ncbi:MAG: hypothetical protein F6J95_028980 [Leptolyngbya sp. SIO1E4]|nr:hypothetical protein [Leptolyngbya sp. SIO1E4]
MTTTLSRQAFLALFQEDVQHQLSSVNGDQAEAFMQRHPQTPNPPRILAHSCRDV